MERREECQGAVGEGSNVQMRSQIVAQGAGKPPLVRTEVRVPVSLGDLYEVLGELGWPGKARADEGDLGIVEPPGSSFNMDVPGVARTADGGSSTEPDNVRSSYMQSSRSVCSASGQFPQRTSSHHRWHRRLKQLPREPHHVELEVSLTS